MMGSGHRVTDGGRLILASGALFASSLLWVLSVIFNFVGPAGPVTAGWIAWAAMALDIPGVLLLAWIYLGLARSGQEGIRARRRWIAYSLVLWSALAAYWRFFLPLGSGTNVEDVFAGLLGANPAGLALVRQSPLLVQELSGVWIAAAALFVLAHALIMMDYRRADEAEWVRGLPAYAWFVASVLSFLGTVGVVAGLLPVLGGGDMGTTATWGAVLKLLVAPNFFLSGYVASLQLGLTVLRMERRGTELASEPPR